jgi:hypothetical protein
MKIVKKIRDFLGDHIIALGLVISSSLDTEEFLRALEAEYKVPRKAPAPTLNPEWATRDEVN